MSQSSEEEVEKYKCFLELWRYDGGLLWRIFGAYLLPHTVLLAFLLSIGFGDRGLTGWNPWTFTAAILGIWFCIIWMISCSRAIALSDLTGTEAKKREPSSWSLLKGPRDEFMEGTYCKMKWYHKLRVRKSVLMIIVTFLTMYSLLAILSGPWMQQGSPEEPSREVKILSESILEDNSC